ncbi:MAG: DNA polymerase I [Candidatus Sungbacteria bacterium]|nr:DNA polymerase I [Candidatus Sungbacteria bacterium]
MNRFILIDAHAIIHRAYHALPPLTSSSGEPVNAVYGFTTILLRMLRELKPNYVAAAFDLAGPTFRHAAYERYKAHRPETPSDLSSQFNKVKRVLDSFGIAIFEKEGYEADDIIGTIAKKTAKDKELEVIVVTGDMDTLQLIRPRLNVYAMKKGVSDIMIYGAKEVKERYGVTPEEMIDFKGLKGDPSDNIPGVKGIGEKTATLLIQEFGSIEGIYAALKKKNKKISPAVAARLEAGAEEAKFSRDLSTIETNVPISFDLEKVRYQDGVPERALDLFQNFGFHGLLKRIRGEASPAAKSGKKEKAVTMQVAMFGDAGGERKTAVLAPESEKEWSAFFARAGKSKVGLILYSADTEGAPQLFLIAEDLKDVLQISPKILRIASVKKYFSEHAGIWTYGAKAIIHFFRAFGIELAEVRYDLELAAYLTGEFSRDFSYIGIASRELGRLVSQDPREEFAHFFEIAHMLEKKLAERNLGKVMFDIDLPLMRILAEMEERGVLLDCGFLEKLSVEIGGEIDTLTKEIYKHAEEEFNINSSQQLSKILFEKLGIKTHGLRKTEKGGVISTSASELEKLRNLHPVIDLILRYRELAKLKTTYVDALPRLINKNTGRLHTTFHQTVAATGRLSSSDPNLQNIPIMSEDGREVRKAFVAEKGFALVAFDYSQIELRVAASLAKDEKMTDAFRKGIDIHALTASEVYNVPLEKVTADLRRAAKTLNFGILYGMGPQSLAEQTGMARDEAKKFIEEYFRDFSGVRTFIEATKTKTEQDGYVETLFGRRRYIPEIYSANWQLKREAERMAVNAPVQGTAADIVKLAMIQVAGWIKKNKKEDSVLLLLQVHDELVFEIKEGIKDAVISEIKKIMEQAADIGVPLVVDVKVGRNWGEMDVFAC